MKSYLRVASAGVDGFEVVSRKEKDADCTVEFIYKNNTLRISGVNEGAAIPDSTLINGTSYLYQELNEMYSDLADILMIKFDESIASVGANSFYATPAQEYVVSSGTEIDNTAFASSSIRNKRGDSPTPEQTPEPEPIPTTEPEKEVLPISTTNVTLNPTDESKSEKSKSPKKEVKNLGLFTKENYNDEDYYVIPNGYTAIEKDAFLLGNLISVKIPNSVKKIGINAFAASRLETIKIPSSVKKISSGAFSWSQLKSIEIPSSIKTISNSAFSNTPMKSVVIPNSVKKIGDFAFENTQLTSVEIPSSVKKIGSNAFKNTELNSVEIPSSIKTIGSRAFMMSNLQTVEIPDSVKTIGDRAFAATRRLKSIEIPSSIKTIGEGVFHLSSSLSSVTIPNSVKTIGDRAFMGTQLTSVTIPKSVKTIGHSAFAGNPLTSVEIPRSVKSIEAFAFGMPELTSVTFKNSSLDLDKDAFSGSNINEITFMNKKQAYAFRRQHKDKFPGSVNVLNKKGELLFVLDALKPSDTGSNAEATEPKTVPSGNEQACPDFQALDQEKIHFINSKNSTKRFVGAEGVSDYFIFSGRKIFERAITSRLETISGFETSHDQIIIGARRLPGLGEIDDIEFPKTSTSFVNALRSSTPLIFIDGTLYYNQNGKAAALGDHGTVVLNLEGNLDCFTEQNILII